MARVVVAVVFLYIYVTMASGQVVGNSCNANNPSQLWTYDLASGTLASGRGACLTASSWPVGDGTSLRMAPCGAGDPRAQAFDRYSANNTFVSRGTLKCINLSGYGTAPGTIVWLYGCSPAPEYTCEGNCDWERLSPASWPSQLANNESGLCLDDGFQPPMPHGEAVGPCPHRQTNRVVPTPSPKQTRVSPLLKLPHSSFPARFARA